jgi:hypothetical protein
MESAKRKLVACTELNLKFEVDLPQKAILSLLEANRGFGTEPLAVASGTRTQAGI